jgi:hypothetical protein
MIILNKVISVLPLAILIISLFGGFNSSAQEINKKDIEEVLLTQFHKQISDSVKGVYGVIQFENPRITSIKTYVLPETSEELKPGKIYEVTLKVHVLNVREPDTLAIILSNDNSYGEFIVKETKKE